MAHQSELIAEDIHAYLKKQEEKGLLRFITCGSVDDGKSTLIGRLLWDSKMVFEDQLCALAADSRRVGTQGQNIDYALLLDGLQAEREQGITIDVAYRYYSTDKRKFIVADTPGHEQYTRNMVTGASTAQVAVILIDARKGVLTQTRRHSYLVSLVGIRHVVLAVNKMDLVDYSRSRFETICREYALFARGLGFEEIAAIPISALEGDNVLTPSSRTPWYAGPTLMTYLETVQIEEAAADGPFRLPVQWVNRPDLDFRGYCGTISSGKIRPGDEVVVTSSGQTSRVDRIVTMDGDLQEAIAGQAVTLTLADEIDISRGDLLASPQTCPQYTDRFEAKLVWLHDKPLQSGRDYLLKTAADTVPARVRKLQYKVNVNSLQQEAGTTLALNEVGSCHIAVSKAIACDRYRNIRTTGSFILIDRLTHATVAAGMIDRPLAQEDLSISLDEAGPRDDKTGRHPALLWFGHHARTLGAEVPQLLCRKLASLGEQVYLLDGLRVRAGLNRDLADGPASDREHLRRLTETARILADAGVTVLVVDGTPGSRPMIDECTAERGTQWREVCCTPGQQEDQSLLLDTDAVSPEDLVRQILQHFSHG